MNFHNIVLAIHNLLRWLVILAAVLALARAYSGWLGRRAWTGQDRTAGVLFTTLLDVQFLFGIILVLMAGIGNLGSFLFEHVIPMVIAIALAHIGSARARSAEGDQNRHRQAAIWFTLAVLVVLIAIPWLRPLFPRL